MILLCKQLNGLSKISCCWPISKTLNKYMESVVKD